MRYVSPIFSIHKIVLIWLLTKNTSVFVPPSVYDTLKYFTETVTPSTLSQIILSHSFPSYSSFCVSIFSKNLLLIPIMSKLKPLLNLKILTI